MTADHCFPSTSPIIKHCGSSSVLAGVSSSIPDGQFSVGVNTLPNSAPEMASDSKAREVRKEVDDHMCLFVYLRMYAMIQ